MFYLDISDFYFFFSDDELKLLRKHVQPINKSDIEKRVSSYFDEKRLSLEAILSALRVNLSNFHEDKD